MNTWVVVGHEGLYWVGLANNEAHAWMIALGWPGPEEINEHKAMGWYATQAQLTWTKPKAEHV